MFLTDLGSLGLDPVFHHLYEYGNVGTFARARPAAGRADPGSGLRPARAQAHGRRSAGASTSASRTACTRATRIKQVKKLLEDPVKGGIAVGDDAVLAALEPRRVPPTPNRRERRASRRASRSAGLATPHYLASGAGAAELARGGNAIDAIIAANLALGVVAPYLCGYGGDLFAIVWDGELHGYLGSGRSPARARHRTRCASSSATTPLLVGPHSVTVPGAIAGWFDLLERWGTRPVRRPRPRRDPLRPRRVRAHHRWARSRASRTPACTAASTTGRPCTARSRPATSCASPRSRRLIELLAADGPDAYYRGRGRRGDRAGDPDAAAGSWRRPTSRRTSGSGRTPMLARVPRRRDRRAPAADPGRRGARDHAHPRRLRPRRARPGRPRAPRHRGGEDRASRTATTTSPIRPTSMMRAGGRCSPTTWIDARAAPRSTRSAPHAPAAGSSATGRDRVPLRRRRRRAAREPHPVELPRRSAPACTSPSGASTSTTGARRSRSTRPG